MLPAEGAEGIDDPVHVLQGHAVHGLVQVIKICLDLFVVGGAALVVALIQHIQNGITVAKAGGV